MKQFGEFPEFYRTLIWKTILQLPENQDAFLSLATKTCHPSYTNLEAKYPLHNKSLCNSLKKYDNKNNFDKFFFKNFYKLSL